MHRIDHPTATSEEKFTGGNPASAEPATVVTADWLNAVQEEIVKVIDAANIPLDKEDNTQLLQALMKMLAPAGTIHAYAGATAPYGYFMCHGQEVSRTNYARLFSVIGTTYGAGDGSTTFNLPDLRAEFIRGLDSGRGVDTGRTLGSWQKGSVHALDHSTRAVFGDRVATTSGTDTRTAAGYDAVTNTAQYSGVEWVAPNAEVTLQYGAIGTSGTEVIHGITRPRNVALNYIIKF